MIGQICGFYGNMQYKRNLTVTKLFQSKPYKYFLLWRYQRGRNL